MSSTAIGREASEGRTEWSDSRRGKEKAARATRTTPACRLDAGWNGAVFFAAGMRMTFSPNGDARHTEAPETFAQGAGGWTSGQPYLGAGGGGDTAPV
jgi:hypothetical protein